MPAYSLSTLKEAIAIKEQIESLESRLHQVLSGSTTPSSSTNKAPLKRSAATIAKMRAAQQARWAKKGKSKPVTKAKSTPAAKVSKKNRTLTPEGRAKLAAAMKARWAARKAGAPAPNAVASNKTTTQTKPNKTTTVYH